MNQTYKPWTVTILFPDSVEEDQWQCIVCDKVTDTAYLVLSQLSHPACFGSVEPVCDDCAESKTLAECLNATGADLQAVAVIETRDI